MNRWILFLPFIGLVVLAGYVGYRMGSVALPSEGEVIARWADEYVGWAGGSAMPTDCYARPGQGEVWMIITCVPDAPKQSITYHVTRNGQLASPDQVFEGPEA